MKKKILEFYKNETPHKIEWILLFAILGFLFVSYVHGDLPMTTRHGIDFWTILFKGRFFHFYDDTQFSMAGDIASVFAFYDITIYIIFAIWNFPLWILETFFKVDIFSNSLCILYAKILLLVFLALVIKSLKEICKEIGVTDKDVKWYTYVFLSSPLLLSSIFVISQYDIIVLFFILQGVLFYLKEDNKKFIFWFAIALTLKPFALFVFIPLLLLREKRVLYLIRNMFFTVIPILICKLLFIKYRTNLGISQGSFALGRFVSNAFPISIDVAYTSILSLIILYIYCYWKHTGCKKDLYLHALYVAFMGYALFFITAHTNPYWIVLLLPFSTILILYNEKQRKINLLLDTVMSGSLLVAQILVFYQCFNLTVVRNMIWPAIFTKIETLKVQIDIDSVIRIVINNEYIVGIAITIFVASMIGLIFVNFPRKSDERNCLDNIEDKIESKICLNRGIIWFRLFVGTVFCSMQIILYFISVILSEVGVTGEVLSGIVGSR